MVSIEIAALECRAKIAAQYHLMPDDIQLKYVAQNPRYFYFDIVNVEELNAKYNVQIWPHDRISKQDLEAMITTLNLPADTAEDVSTVEEMLRAPYQGYERSLTRIISNLIQAVTMMGIDRFYQADRYRSAANDLVNNMPAVDYNKFANQFPGARDLAKTQPTNWTEESLDRFADEYDAWLIHESMYTAVCA